MKSNVVMYWALCAFFAVVAVMYAVWGLLGAQSGVVTMDPNNAGHIEPAGTIALGLCAVLFGFIAFYIGKTYKSQGGELPEDLDDANIDDGDPELGHFSPWSWWPVLLAGSVSLVFLGVAIGPWIAFIGVALLAVTLVGWVYEYYRGYFGH